MRTCRWSIASIALSVGSIAASYAIVQYLYRSGSWNPDAVFSHNLQAYSAYAILASFALAIIGMFRDRPFWVGIVAFVLSCLGVLSLAPV
jgi:hypothetical protein